MENGFGEREFAVCSFFSEEALEQMVRVWLRAE